MKWAEKKSDKNTIKKPVIVFPYKMQFSGDLHDYNGSWLTNEGATRFNLIEQG